jgi:hypothetical protein
MINLRAMINERYEGRAGVSRFGAHLTADEFEQFIAVLMDIRSRMTPMPGEKPFID